MGYLLRKLTFQKRKPLDPFMDTPYGPAFYTYASASDSVYVTVRTDVGPVIKTIREIQIGDEVMIAMFWNWDNAYAGWDTYKVTHVLSPIGSDRRIYLVGDLIDSTLDLEAGRSYNPPKKKTTWFVKDEEGIWKDTVEE